MYLGEMQLQTEYKLQTLYQLPTAMLYILINPFQYHGKALK